MCINPTGNPSPDYKKKKSQFFKMPIVTLQWVPGTCLPIMNGGVQIQYWNCLLQSGIIYNHTYCQLAWLSSGLQPAHSKPEENFLCPLNIIFMRDVWRKFSQWLQQGNKSSCIYICIINTPLRIPFRKIMAHSDIFTPLT